MPPRASACVRWTWTYQCADSAQALSAVAALRPLYPGRVRYLICQLEKAPNTGQLHLQGYLELRTRQRLTALRSLLPELTGAHWENAIASAEVNKEYCSKEDSVELVDGVALRLCLGAPSQSIHLDQLLDEIQAGSITAPIHLISKLGVSAYMRHGREARKMLLDYGQPRSSPPTIFTLIGKTGTGKSRYCHEVWPDRYRMIFSNGGSDGSVWFDGYEGQPIIEFSEYNGQLKLTFLLELLDRYPCRVQTKGGTANLLAHIFIFTSNTKPCFWYMSEEQERVDALMRRFKDFGIDIADYQDRTLSLCNQS